MAHLPGVPRRHGLGVISYVSAPGSATARRGPLDSDSASAHRHVSVSGQRHEWRFGLCLRDGRRCPIPSGSSETDQCDGQQREADHDERAAHEHDRHRPRRVVADPPRRDVVCSPPLEGARTSEHQARNQPDPANDGRDRHEARSHPLPPVAGPPPRAIRRNRTSRTPSGSRPDARDLGCFRLRRTHRPSLTDAGCRRLDAQRLSAHRHAQAGGGHVRALERRGNVTPSRPPDRQRDPT